MLFLILCVTLMRMILAYRRRKEQIFFYDEMTNYFIHLFISTIIFDIILQLL